jgi:hypothetical protein
MFFRHSSNRVAARYLRSKFFCFGRVQPMYTDEAMRILGIPATATLDEAKKAYRTMMMQHHPDRGGTHEKAVEIGEAWEQLKNGLTIPRKPPRQSPPFWPYSPPNSPYQPYAPPPPPPPDPVRNPYVQVTWQLAERLTGVRSVPERKDRERIANMVVRCKGDGKRLMVLANQMANSIDLSEKALRRGRSAEEFNDISLAHGDAKWVATIVNPQVSRIFYNRAFVLLGLRPL